MKPGDFLLGVLEFFAILLPGALATCLFSAYVPAPLGARLDITAALPQGDDGARWAVFLLVAYALGHFVFMAGSRLDTFYDQWRTRYKPTSRDHAFQAASSLRKQLVPELEGSPFTTLKWAKAFIQIHAPICRSEIDRLEADSKFFRGLVVVALLAAFHFAWKEELAWVVASVLTGYVSFIRFCDRRWKLTELAYATALIVHAKVKDRGPAEAPASPAADD